MNKCIFLATKASDKAKYNNYLKACEQDMLAQILIEHESYCKINDYPTTWQEVN
tara:strand:+ start:1204 stop:1365 length:162 start_codon:yes stop_codon:yes gene_type:complete